VRGGCKINNQKEKKKIPIEIKEYGEFHLIDTRRKKKGGKKTKKKNFWLIIKDRLWWGGNPTIIVDS